MENKKSTNMEVRKNNRINIFQYIRRHEITSNPDIAYELKISLPTVTQNTKELIERGLVKEAGKLKSTGGKRATALSVVSDFRLAVGLDITGNHISFVLADLKGELLGYDRIFKPYEHTDDYYQTVNALLEQFIEKNHVKPERILGIGISIPGIVDVEKEEITYSHVLKLEAVPFAFIRSFFSFPCYFLNDANAGAYAEGIHTEAADRFFYLSLSTTVGGAIFDKGELVQGREFRCGEVGHMAIAVEGDTCYCGKKGCLDVYCSARRLADMADGNLGMFFSRLEQGEDAFVKAWEVYTSYLALALDNICMVLDCEIILGGYVGGYMENRLEDVRKKVAERYIFGKKGTLLRACTYKFEAAALGAALSVIEDFVEQI